MILFAIMVFPNVADQSYTTSTSNVNIIYIISYFSGSQAFGTTLVTFRAILVTKGKKRRRDRTVLCGILRVLGFRLVIPLKMRYDSIQDVISMLQYILLEFLILVAVSYILSSAPKLKGLILC